MPKAHTEQVFSYTLITSRQREILDFILRQHQETGLVASVREIQRHFKFSSSNAVAVHLRALERKGYLVRSKGKARSLIFLNPGERSGKPPSSADATATVHDDGTQLTLGAAIEDDRFPCGEEPAAEATSSWVFDHLPLGADLVKLDNSAGLIRGDALALMERVPESSIHSIVTDPPYGLVEYDDDNHTKLRLGKGGVWRIPPKLNGVERSPLPRFTVLTGQDRARLVDFFTRFGCLAVRALAPGGHLIIASNPLLSTITFHALLEAGFEKRGEIIRLVTTLRGGDRPKGAEGEFPGVSVMPRSCWEPWGLFRKPLSEPTVGANLRKWGTGGCRRLSPHEPFKDVIECPPARGAERELAPHPSLKPQRLLRYLVRASLPLGQGVVLDPFAGSGSTLAAASALGYHSIGFERDKEYCELAKRAFSGLKGLPG